MKGENESENSKEEKSQSGTLAKKTYDYQNMHGMEIRSEVELICVVFPTEKQSEKKNHKNSEKKIVSRATLFFKYPIEQTHSVTLTRVAIHS